jgi:hypothetical protein
MVALMRAATPARRGGPDRPDLLYGLPLPTPGSGVASIVSLAGTGRVRGLARRYGRGLDGWQGDLAALTGDLRLSVAAWQGQGSSR